MKISNSVLKQFTKNILKIFNPRLEGEGPWMIENPEMWEGTPAEELVRKDMTREDGTQYEFADRRQELVFIGMGLKHQVMQKALDQCLLTDEEMKMKPIQWFEKWEAIDKLKYVCIINNK